MLLTHLKLNSYISRAQWPHVVVATDQTAHLQMPRVSLHSSLPRVATCPILPCLTSVACKLLEFRSQTCALNSCAQSSAYRQTRLHPHPHSTQDQVLSISVPSQCLWDVLSGMKG